MNSPNEIATSISASTLVFAATLVALDSAAALDLAHRNQTSKDHAVQSTHHGVFHS